MNRSVCLALVGLLACRAAPSAEGPAPADSAEARVSGAPSRVTREIDPCTEVGVIVPRLSLDLHAPRTGLLSGGGAGLHGEGERLYEVEVGDDVAVLEVQVAELEEAKATRERYAAEQVGRARDLRGAEQLGDHLAERERDVARDAHTVSTRELHRADAARKAAAARLEAQRARIQAGRLDAPFSGRVIQELVIPGAWVSTGQMIARFASTEDLVLRVGLPAEHGLRSPIEARWYWPDRADERFTVTLEPTRDEVDELSGLRLYEARVDSRSRGNHPLGGVVRVELPICHAGPDPGDANHDPR
jgi:biotin carboxyl carrier protein